MDTLCLCALERKIERFIHHHHLHRRRPGPPGTLSLAQLTVVCIARAWFGVEHWKAFFSNPLVQAGWKKLGGFDLGSYGRFMLRQPQALPVLEAWIAHNQQPWTGMGAIDSTLVATGKPWTRYDKTKYKRLRREGAGPGYGSTGPCFGLKLHLATTDRGQVHAFCLTPAPCHDLHPVKQGLLDQAVGVVLADSGYVSQREQRRLQAKSVALWARPARHHEARFTLAQSRVYRCREVAESIFAKLKQRFSLVPRWPPRTLTTCQAHILGSLIAYMLHPNKPTMRWSFKDFKESRS